MSQAFLQIPATTVNRLMLLCVIEKWSALDFGFLIQYYRVTLTKKVRVSKLAEKFSIVPSLIQNFSGCKR